MKHTTFRPNGVLTFNLGAKFAWTALKFTGGPFDEFVNMTSPEKFGVCVRSERVPPKVDVHLPIRDYDVPSSNAFPAVEAALKDTLHAALTGRDVYIGCMGGWGRTGLFMALIAKAVGEADPVGFVRSNYTSHAVETSEQKAYVARFDVTEIRRWLMRETWKIKFKGFLGLR